MSRFGRIMIGIVVFVIIASIAAVWYFGRHTNQLMSTALNETLTLAFGDRHQIGELRFDVFEGTLQVQDVVIANPAGFSDHPAIAIGSISAVVDMNSMAGARVDVLKLMLSDVNLRLEETDTGLLNLQQLQDQVRLLHEEEKRNSGGRRFAIDAYNLVNLSMEANVLSGERYGLLLPDERWTKLGFDTGGLSAAEAMNTLLQPMISAALNAAVEEDLLPDSRGEQQTLKDLKDMIEAIDMPPVMEEGSE